ncbi:calcium-independent phospholipase A2-gamma-like isoform X1 [Centruroides sculpturatus]|uniref:calcium-independent phospholipase A2-gamma-like isoform X1 n=1 Tax=Centruroides sculpturatus TaxID=218467 RepID=UPI000C6CCEA2|nr:calcium-independent phospholipase A2-gamma-like isoform X1 [Centruroides sculpturatus]XP_023211073.1 calcium-independent phospholipase A2-gamma-like isoform X1 [Centruroides sculpturatus]
MTASPQPQVRTIHQIQHLLSMLRKGVTSLNTKMPSYAHISKLFKRRELKIKRTFKDFTNLVNIVKFHWKPTVNENIIRKVTVTPAIKETSNAPKFSQLKLSSTGHVTNIENEKSIEIDKALTEWLNSDTNDVLLSKESKKQIIEKKSKTGFEKIFFDWFRGETKQFKFPVSRNWTSFQNNEKAVILGSKVAKGSIENRSRFLAKSLLSATSETSKLYRLQEMCKHLLRYPEEKNTMVKENAIPIALKLRETSGSEVKESAQEVLSLLGYVDPPRSTGVRILTIDGGGIRGIIAIEMLRYLETISGKPIHELFDYICGVSTGAILTMLIGGLNLPINECEKLYLKMSCELFKRSPILGTGGLIWSHSYYDTNMWVNMLKDVYGELSLNETARKKGNPKMSAVSAVMNQPLLQPFLFRNYALPYRVQSLYPGNCSHKLWQAIRASAAAPGYFEQYHLDGIVHQDGGLIMNNPTALAVHEAKLLWPKEKIQCILSLGNGRFIPTSHKITTSTSLMTMLMKVIDSATDTESFHIVLQDHLPTNVYFRINPYLSERVSLDETKTEKLELLKKDAQKYIEWNETKIRLCMSALVKQRTYVQKLNDWLKVQYLIQKSKSKADYI